MTLLVHPPALADEGPSGYRLRLVDRNRLPLTQLRNLEALAGVGLAVRPHDDNENQSIGWLTRFARFCPRCLTGREAWHVAWEIPFADACPVCGHWLVDRCSVCDRSLTWRRNRVFQCSCDHVLTGDESVEAPRAVVRLSRALCDLASGRHPIDLPLLAGLSADDAVQVVHLLGSFGSKQGFRSLRSVSEVDRLEVSWPISSFAAEVLTSWPSSIVAVLRSISAHSSDADRGSLARTFGGFYRAIFTTFSGVQFEFLRVAFCSYVAEHWSGALARRNTRLRETVLAAMPWIPALAACRELGISRKRLGQLVAEGRLLADRRQTAKGRTFTVINRASMTNIERVVDHGEDLQTVAAHFGLKRARFAEMLSILCTEARRKTALGPAWMIPYGWIEQWQDLLDRQPTLGKFKSGMAEPMSTVLRYRNWSGEQVASFLVEVQAGNIKPLGIYRDVGRDRISNLVFARRDLDAWRASKSHDHRLPLTVRDCAALLHVKQEVAYSLVRSRLLRAEAVRVGRRLEQCTCCAWLEEFNERYVFGRDLASTLRRSPRHLVRLLSAMGINPVAGPGIDSCRQIVYERAAVEPAVAISCAAPAVKLHSGCSEEHPW